MSKPKKENYATSWPGRDKSIYFRYLHVSVFTEACMQGAKGGGVDLVKAATVMTVAHAYSVRISQSLGGLGKRSSAVSRESALKCKTTR
jgi:hypothetical protein